MRPDLQRCFEATAGLPAAMVFLALAYFAPPAYGQSSPWRFEPTLAVGLEYDDNAVLFAGLTDDVSAEGYQVEASARLSYLTELSTFSLTPILRFGRYDESELDFDDKLLNLRYNRQGQVSRFNFRGQFSDQAIRTGERFNVDFDVDNPDEIPNDDSARVFRSESRQRLRLTPEFTRNLGPKSSVGVRIDYLDLSFPDDIQGILTDYTSTRVDGLFEYRWSPRDAWTLRAFHRENEFESGDDGSGVGALIGYRRNLSETSRLIVRAGYDSTNDTIDGDRATTPIGQLSYIRNFTRTRFLASYRRAVAGGGGGRLTVRNSIDLTLTRNVSQRVSTGFGVGGYTTRSLDNSDPSIRIDERDYLQLRGFLSWRVTRSLALDLDYRHTYVDRLLFDGDANSNALVLWFRYAPNRREAPAG